MACSAGTSHLQDIGEPRLGYRIPDLGGVITQWNFRAGAAGGTIVFQVLEDAGTFQYYTPVAESAAEPVAPSSMNSFPARTPVEQGQLIGLRIVSGSPECRYEGFPTGLDATSEASPGPVLGSGPTLFGTEHDGSRLNVAAVLEDDDDHDGFGDETQDACTTNPRRQDDCVDPVATLYKGVPKKRRITFAFRSNEPGTFECRIDQSKFKPCKSPLKLKRLKVGKHHFNVRAVDLNGNKSLSEVFTWAAKKG